MGNRFVYKSFRFHKQPQNGISLKLNELDLRIERNYGF